MEKFHWRTVFDLLDSKLKKIFDLLDLKLKKAQRDWEEEQKIRQELEAYEQGLYLSSFFEPHIKAILNADIHFPDNIKFNFLECRYDAEKQRWILTIETEAKPTLNMEQSVVLLGLNRTKAQYCRKLYRALQREELALTERAFSGLEHPTNVQIASDDIASKRELFKYQIAFLSIRYIRELENKFVKIRISFEPVQVYIPD